MNYKFVNVFTKEDRDKLILAGYKLMKSDDEKSIYVFINDSSLSCNFSDDDEISMVLTNTLTF